MNCDSFASYMGSSPSTSQQTYPNDRSSIGFSAINRTISGAIVVFIILYFLVLHFFFKKKIQEMVHSSVFSIFDDLLGEFHKETVKKRSKKIIFELDNLKNESDIFSVLRINTDYTPRSTSMPSFEKEEFKLLNREIAKALERESGKIEDKQEIVYICSFDKCCCECLCQSWYRGFYEKRIKLWVREIWKRGGRFFKRHLKSFCFYFLMIGTFIYNPLRNVLIVIFNDCHLGTRSNSWPVLLVFNFIDLACGSLAITLYYFLISFLSTEAEFLKIYLFDKGYRARLMYYHLKKALIFGFLHFFLKLSYKIAMNMFSNPFDDAVGDIANAWWVIFKNLFLVFSTKFYNGHMDSSIDQDCNIQRAHARYFIIQSNLIKGVPRSMDIYKIIKKDLQNKEKTNINSEENPKISKRTILGSSNLLTTDFLEEKISKKCSGMGKSIHEELSIISTQKFKNVITNKGELRFIPRLFILVLEINCLMCIVICIMLLLVLENYWSYSNIYNWAEKAYAGTWFIECTVLPFFIYYSLKKRTYLPIKTIKYMQDK